MSFSCPHCHFQNSEVQSAGQIQEHGLRCSLVVAETSDLSRQVVKSDTCITKFVELDVEIPPGRGQLTNIEGLLTMLIEDLEFKQTARRSLDPDLYSKLDMIITKGQHMLKGESFPFTVTIDDPAGNSWIEPSVDNRDGRWTRSEYKRTSKQNEALSLSGPEDDTADPGLPKPQNQAGSQPPEDAGHGTFESEIVPDEVYSFPATCPGCSKPCTTNMKMVNIPHFREVVIMSTVCDYCGCTLPQIDINLLIANFFYPDRSNEVKTGGAVPSKGQRVTLTVRNAVDLARDILKSETCALSSPELSLSVNPGTLGGRFTTVEGLLTQIRDDLHGQIFDIDDLDSQGGDSLAVETKTKWSNFFATLDKAIKAEIPFTMVLEDPWASSYVQNLCAPEMDPQLDIEDYERTEEENEDLGLNDIQVEGYTKAE